MKNSEIYEKHQKLTEMIFENSNLLPSRYVLVLTNRCNLNCSFCFQEKKSSPNHLTTDEWIEIIKQFPLYSRVTITGGEPLIYKDFKKIFIEVASRHDCNLITNGLLLNKEIIDLLLEYENFKTLSISIDTIGNINRGVTKSQWDRLVENLNYFIEQRDKKNIDCKLDVKTTILDENISKLYEIYRYCKEILRVDFHSFAFLKGSSLQHSDVMYEYEDIFKEYKAYRYKNFASLKEQFRLIAEYNRQNDQISFAHPKVVNLDEDYDEDFDFINEESFEKSRFKLCKFPWSSVHINYDGNLFPCLSVSFGNLKKDSLKDVINSKIAKRFKSDLLKHKLFLACNRCGWLKVDICGLN